MPLARGLAATHTSPQDVRHPKLALYDHAYDPLTRTWFELLALSREREKLLSRVPAEGLIKSLESFNALFHQLVDDTLEATRGLADIIDIVSAHRAHVLWAGHMPPGETAGTTEVNLSLSQKMKRNISLGVIEALICLESAVQFCRTHLGLEGPETESVVARSRRLYTSLAVLHDEHEKLRLMFLTGIDGHLAYPDVDYHHVLDGSVRITADKFVMTGPPDARALRFVPGPRHDVELDSPVQRCPAHRLRSPEDPQKTLNDVLWDLLVDIYRRAGRFA